MSDHCDNCSRHLCRVTDVQKVEEPKIKNNTSAFEFYDIILQTY